MSVSLSSVPAVSGAGAHDPDRTDLQVRVDQELCTGDGLCVQVAPKVFEFDIDGLAYVKDADGRLHLEVDSRVPVPAGWVLEVLDAAQQCPGECIFVTDSEGLPIGGPDAD